MDQFGFFGGSIDSFDAFADCLGHLLAEAERENPDFNLLPIIIQN